MEATTCSGPENPLAAHFISRLRRLVELDRAVGTATIDTRWRLLVHKAVFSTWLDCRELGLGEDVARLMGTLTRPSDPALPGRGES